MEIKETAFLRVLSAQRRITLPQTPVMSAEVAPQIEAEAGRLGMQVTGPWTFIATSLPKDKRTEFDLRMCLPVAYADRYSGPFELLDMEPIMVASTIYRGPVRGLFTRGYAPLISKIENSRHAFSGESREIYHQWNGSQAQYHMIEIQFGLAY